jgi:Uma2 family endonuclease
MSATPEDLLSMPDGKSYELVDGELVERQPGMWASYVGSRLGYLLANHIERQALGWAWGAGCGYQCFPRHPDRVRKPRFSFIRRSRFPADQAPDDHLHVAPDLAGEVIAPADRAYEVAARVEDYLSAGTRLVWVVDPRVRTVLIYRLDGTIAGLREDGELDGEDVLPGSRCPVGELFRTPEAPPEPLIVKR